MKSSPDIVIVGAGPAGLMAAIAAAGAGGKVVVLEQMDSPGRKLLATGGGRCNLTNTAAPAEMMAAFGRQGRFMSDALKAMDAPALRAFFDSLGVPTVCPEGFEVYPASQKASDVLAALLQRCRELGVDIRTGQTVRRLTVGPDGRVAGVETVGGPVAARAVILCCGGRSYPSLGATGAGYELVASVGHTIVPPTAAGVGLVCRENYLAGCAGVSIADARVWIDLPKFAKVGRRGSVLFTHRGISGPAVLDLSGDVAELLRDRAEVPLRLDLAPDEPKPAWLKRIDDWSHEHGARSIAALLAAHVPASVAQIICHQSSVSGIAPMAHIDRERRNLIVDNVKSLKVTAVDTEGFDHAIVTRGGVSLKQVDPRTLASRLVGGLYFAGELLDLDGPCGGYNLQWAFSSGWLAGLSAATRDLTTEVTENTENT